MKVFSPAVFPAVALLGALISLSGCYARKPEAEARPPSHLAYIVDGEAIDRFVYRILPDGSGQRLLANKGLQREGQDLNLPNPLQWSPDGKRLAFASYDSLDGEISLINADGTGLVSLTSNLDEDYGPVWSPDGSQIAYCHKSYETQANQIQIIDSQGGLPRTLISKGWDPHWSPDGKEIAFVSQDDDLQDIYIISADRSHIRLLPTVKGDTSEPAWSPDGSQIAYTSCTDDTQRCQLRLIQADGSQDHELVPLETVAYGARWSPDGRQLAFSNIQSDGNTWVELIGADGKGRRVLAQEAGASFAPAWSPAGDRIVFQFRPEGEEIMHIAVINADGTGLKHLKREAIQGLKGKDISAFWPSWSP
jgi:Tol biopolymer transport system component